jgi:hypothetical protein
LISGSPNSSRPGHNNRNTNGIAITLGITRRFEESCRTRAGPRATPTLSNNRVYTFGATGILNALDANTGAVLWTRNVSSETNTKIPFWGFNSSLTTLRVAIVAGLDQTAAAATARPSS